MSMESFWNGQAEWSQATFGTDVQRGPTGSLRHLAREVLTELLGVPREEVDRVLKFAGEAITAPGEYVDLQFLVFDAARRSGMRYSQLVDGCHAKLAVNRNREWPKFDPNNINEAVEHVRSPSELMPLDSSEIGERFLAAPAANNLSPEPTPVRQFEYDGGKEVEVNFKGKVCEVCKQPATRAVHDLSPDGRTTVTAWFCYKHVRKAAQLGNFS